MLGSYYADYLRRFEEYRLKERYGLFGPGGRLEFSSVRTIHAFDEQTSFMRNRFLARVNQQQLPANYGVNSSQTTPSENRHLQDPGPGPMPLVTPQNEGHSRYQLHQTNGSVQVHEIIRPVANVQHHLDNEAFSSMQASSTEDDQPSLESTLAHEGGDIYHDEEEDINHQVEEVINQQMEGKGYQESWEMQRYRIEKQQQLPSTSECFSATGGDDQTNQPRTTCNHERDKMRHEYQRFLQEQINKAQQLFMDLNSRRLQHLGMTFSDLEAYTHTSVQSTQTDTVIEPEEGLELQLASIDFEPIASAPAMVISDRDTNSTLSDKYHPPHKRFDEKKETPTDITSNRKQTRRKVFIKGGICSKGDKNWRKFYENPTNVNSTPLNFIPSEP